MGMHAKSFLCLVSRDFIGQKSYFFILFYQSVENGFASFHLYVCAAFLKNFSQEIIQENDFQVCLFARLFVFHLFAFCTCHVARRLFLDCIL